MGLGKKQMEQLGAFSLSAAAYGVGSLVALLYVTEWKAVCKYIPFYNMAEKFRDPLPPPKPKPT
ncbi:unnamed protein product [Spodoptera littoralis]|uniref:Cytochrome b-c1 complex subunit 10 n=1 Tax=Spodoptera littoralis TaxID=7109 RepID=A0A9P0MVT5_SPOLI|nr:unnamed protein product [Spodoptera littoralis]CAH1635206.1 unnamed protein product [Spodoptera littoralis]